MTMSPILSRRTTRMFVASLSVVCSRRRSRAPTRRPSKRVVRGFRAYVTSVTKEPSYDTSWPRDTPVASGSLAQAIRYLDLDKAADEGLNGTGVRAAVIDSGIDFTHANLGGRLATRGGNPEGHARRERHPSDDEESRARVSGRACVRAQA